MKFCAVPMCQETKAIILFKEKFNELKKIRENSAKKEMFHGPFDLTVRELFVLDMRFDNEGCISLSRPKIGKLLNVCAERIRQIEEKALRKLRQPSRHEDLKNFLKEEGAV